uniref:Uncharacterized protein n=1 Tax=viral metagenome TaxID=1070528 RepID=A0A6H2A698_9ZZZZ
MQKIWNELPRDQIIGCPWCDTSHRNDEICMEYGPTLCACGKRFIMVYPRDRGAGPILICDECHKINAQGWKWG